MALAFKIKKLDDYDIFWADYICAVTKMNRDSVLISYSQDGQISSKINENGAYVHTDFKNSNVNHIKERIYKNYDDNIKMIQNSMRELSVSISFYGPKSDVLAWMVADSFSMPSSLLTIEGIKIAEIPDSDYIVKTHERINGRWWDRADLKFDFYDVIETSQDIDSIENLDIKIYNDLKE